MSTKIGVACDHAGYQMKEFLVGYLASKGFDVVDYGCHSEESVDYADFGHALAKGIECGEVKSAVALCGSGEGMAMTLNKHQSIRAGLCWSEDVARLIKEHNNANIIVLPARFVDYDLAIAMVKVWLESTFEGGRHQNRLEKMPIK